MVRFFNTLSRRKEEFKPLDGKSVRGYTCGPTVYNYPHIGNYRAYVFADLLRRFLEWDGFSVKLVMNITDVDDKTIRDSKKAGETLKAFTRKYEKAFHEDLKALNVLPAHQYPRATEHIPEMVALVGKLLEKGKAYESPDGSVYFKISSFKGYGKLSGLKKDDLQEGASGRVKKDEYSKENASDFVLWKAYDEADGDVYWDTPFGKGRPGWHIECSALSSKYLGETFDIHTGGVDLIFPHHENEIAQSEGASGKPFVACWMHNEHLLVDGKKMSKSLGNFFTLRDLLSKGHKPLAVRYALVSTHYRSQMNFTFDALKTAENTLIQLQNFISRLEEATEGKAGMEDKKPENKVAAGKNKTGKSATEKTNVAGKITATEANETLGKKLAETKEKFKAALEDDLDVSTALAACFELERETNKALDAGTVTKALAQEISAFFWDDFNTVFGVLEKRAATKKFKVGSAKEKTGGAAEITCPEDTPDEVVALAMEREAARKAKDFKKSDELRDKIKALGFAIDDTPNGSRLRKL